MHRTLHVALGGAALTLGALVALPGVALAQEVDCDDDQVAALYPGVCIDEPGTPIGGGTGGGGTGVTPTTPPPATGTPSTGGGTATGGTTTGAGSGGAASLPFTGDEVLVLSLAGAGALAAGTALAAAGRRRRTPTA